MFKLRITAALVACPIVITLSTGAGSALASGGNLTPIEDLGKKIFFDEDLSIRKNQSCASCHGPEAGWTGPDSDFNAHGAVYEGSIKGKFGNRKPPSSAYASLATATGCLVTTMISWPATRCSWAAISGTVVRRVGSWVIPQPIRPRGPS